MKIKNKNIGINLSDTALFILFWENINYLNLSLFFILGIYIRNL